MAAGRIEQHDAVHRAGVDMVINEAQEIIRAALVDLAGGRDDLWQFARQWPTPSVTIWNDIASAGPRRRREQARTPTPAAENRGCMSHKNLAPATPRS